MINFCRVVSAILYAAAGLCWIIAVLTGALPVVILSFSDWLEQAAAELGDAE